ncbi:MAG: WhiB family transcriptional regulator [Friedmanniella sp.]
MSTARLDRTAATNPDVPLIGAPAPSGLVAPTRRRTVVGQEPPPHWRDFAACIEEDLNLFFPISTVGAAAARQVEAAKQVCRACPVQQSCLEWALEVGPEFGIFGGRTEVERRRLRSRRAAGQHWRAAGVPGAHRSEQSVAEDLEPR